MLKWIRKILKKRKQKKDYVRLLQEHVRLLEEQDEEYKTLLLLQGSICGKHHG